MIIAIDGPVASGKGTISKILARKLNCLCLDTGAIYRAIALCDLRGQDYRKKNIEVHYGHEKKTVIFVDDEDVTNQLRSFTVSKHVAQVAADPAVQERVHQIQRATAVNLDMVVEGRETTSVTFPRAEFKFYLTASLQERAARRFRDFTARGEKVTWEEVLQTTAERDRIDMERPVAPLIKVPNAIEIDTTGRGVDEVVDEMMAIILK